MNKIIIFLALASLILCEHKTTHDPEFEKQFTVKHIKEGDGKKFDSSYDRNDPLSFTLGVGQVIQCWDMSVARLSVGEKISVVCPSALAYGERGAGRIIPPNSDLVFEMELVSIDKKTSDL